MRSAIRRHGGRRAAGRPVVAGRVGPARRRGAKIRGFAASAAVAALVGTLALAPLQPVLVVAQPVAERYAPDEVQQVAVADDVAGGGLAHESYLATTGSETLVEGGTNYDWAKLVLVFGGWPLTDDNVTVMVEWMREENGPPDWFNRNNPLNNGYGSGGGSGLGSYDDLVDAARYAADNLKKRSFYADIVAGFERGDSAEATRAAIWASPWASSHYGGGSWWSVNPPVPAVEAPPEAWG